MDLSTIPSFAQYGPAILIMALMIFWLTRQNDKEKEQNQENLNRFILVTERYSTLTEKVSSSLDNYVLEMRQHSQKLGEIHDDIKIIKAKK